MSDIRQSRYYSRVTMVFAILVAIFVLQGLFQLTNCALDDAAISVFRKAQSNVGEGIRGGNTGGLPYVTISYAQTIDGSMCVVLI